MTELESKEPGDGILQQKGLWRRQVSSIPSLLGGKSVWVPLTIELVQQIGTGNVLDLNEVPKVSFESEGLQSNAGGASPRKKPASWKEYYQFLRGMNLVEKSNGALKLTPAGVALQSDPSPDQLARIMADRFRLFSEVLSILSEHNMTVEEVHEVVQKEFEPNSKTSMMTRSRMDWQEKLGLITSVGGRKWAATTAGREFVSNRTLVSPGIFEKEGSADVNIEAAPPEIDALLEDLRDSVRSHESRNTYNIWVPSPHVSPNKVNNLRTIINATINRIDREELFSFICDTFALKRSSVESMFPFMRASGLIVEVGRGVYEATPAARAWIESDDDINFIRILHANMRFVGEMIKFVEADVLRSETYSEANLYGLNTDKCRWIVSFMLSVELIEEPRYGSLRATALGCALMKELPLSPVPLVDDSSKFQVAAEVPEPVVPEEESTSMDIVRYSRDPHGQGLKMGRAFENSIHRAFRLMGFDARVISGSGDTDVLIQWIEEDGSRSAAVLEAKSRSNGMVSHTDISDVAIETHKDRNHAQHVAIIGPSFSGDTIRNMAKQRKWCLIEAEQLANLVNSVNTVGLKPSEAAIMFKFPSGLSDLDELLASRSRELEVISFLFSKLVEEFEETGEAISARDIARDGRKTELAPRTDEIVSAIDLVSRFQLDALRSVDSSDDPRYATYQLGDVSSSARKLRAIADAIEKLPFN